MSSNGTNASNDKPPSSYKGIKYIFIANLLETFYRVYQGLPDKERNFWNIYDTLEGNRALLYNGDNKVIITAQPIQTEHREHICDLLGWENVHNLSPRLSSPSICEDIVRPGKFGDTVEQMVKDNPGVGIIPYRATKEFYRLTSFLTRKGLKFTMPETVPEENEFISMYCNSKRGFRHYWNRALGSNTTIPIDIPDGFIVGNKDEAIEAAWWFQQKRKSFVMKVNRGTQGVGISFFKSSQMPHTEKAFQEDIRAKLGEKVWEEPAIVVEELISQDLNVLNGSPSVEFYINPEGQVSPTYGGEQIFAADRKTFSGFYIHPEATYHPYIQTAFRAGIQFGEELADVGYHGYFDIDLVCGKDNQLYAVESNLRRTGGTHIHDLAVSLLGKGYVGTHHVLGEDIHLPQDKRTNYTECFKAFKSVLYNPSTQTGFIFGNPDMLQVNILHGIFIAPTKKKLDEIRRKVNSFIAAL